MKTFLSFLLSLSISFVSFSQSPGFFEIKAERDATDSTLLLIKLIPLTSVQGLAGSVLTDLTFTVTWPVSYGVDLNVGTLTSIYGMTTSGARYQTSGGTYFRIFTLPTTKPLITTAMAVGTPITVMSVSLPQNVLGMPPTGNFSINPWGTPLTAIAPAGLNLGVDPYLSIDRTPAPNFDTFEEYEIAVAGSAAVILLPLKLADFGVKAGKEAIDLRWNTENEENMRGFNIERSIDGKKFKSIGSVEAKNVSKAAYTYTDKDVTKNQVYYYRLRMIEKDGQSRTSEIQSAKIEAAIVVASTGVNIYPNPTNGNVSLDFILDQDTHTEVDVFDITGKLTLHKEVEAKKDKNLISLEMLDMPSGVYTVRINMGGKVTNKIVKVSKN